MTDRNETISINHLVIELLSVWSDENKNLFLRKPSYFSDADCLDDVEVFIGYDYISLKSRHADIDEIREFEKTARQLLSTIAPMRKIQALLEHDAQGYLDGKHHPWLEFVTTGIGTDQQSLQSIYIRKASAYLWAKETYSKEIAKWDPANHSINPSDDTHSPTKKENEALLNQIRWSDVTIRLLKGNRVSFSITGKKTQQVKELYGTELLNKRTKELRDAGLLLAGLAKRLSIPTGQQHQKANSRRKAVSVLRSCLKQLSGISADPFYDHNPEDGWKPRFKLLDRRSAADERAQQKAVHIPYDDERAPDKQNLGSGSASEWDEYTFDDEDDVASDFLKEHDR